MVEKDLSLWCSSPKWRKPARSRSSVSAVWPLIHMPIVRSGEPIWTWVITIVYKTELGGIKLNRDNHIIMWLLFGENLGRYLMFQVWSWTLLWFFFNISRIFLDLGKYLMFQVWSWALLFLFPPTGWQFNRSAATLATWQEVLYFVLSSVRSSFSLMRPYSTQSYNFSWANF